MTWFISGGGEYSERFGHYQIGVQQGGDYPWLSGSTTWWASATPSSISSHAATTPSCPSTTSPRASCASSRREKPAGSTRPWDRPSSALEGLRRTPLLGSPLSARDAASSAGLLPISSAASSATTFARSALRTTPRRSTMESPLRAVSSL